MCAACSYVWLGIVEIGEDELRPCVSLECPVCHAMAGGPAPSTVEVA